MPLLDVNISLVAFRLFLRDLADADDEIAMSMISGLGIERRYIQAAKELLKDLEDEAPATE